MSVFDEWLSRAEKVIDECLIPREVDTTTTTVDGIPLSRYASLKLESMDSNSDDGDDGNRLEFTF